ncbi:MAG TPA: hypothetical protein VHZ51_06795 [Ktedonobacteraceae bacterium]|jgi:hypothetical protein|nr:hypothetical protein [Ktedonobacteraceae bacterium]
MIHREVPYKRFAFIAGALLLLLALYQAFNVASAPFSANGSAQSGYFIFVQPAGALLTMLSTGVLTPLAVAVLLLGVAAPRITITYWCIQAALWLAGISFWYQSGNTSTGQVPNMWPWLILTLVCSLLLLVSYKLVIQLFAKYLNESSTE